MCGPPGYVHAGDDVVDQQQAGVPAGDHERHDPVGEQPVHQLVDGGVADDVVDPVERLAEAVRERLRGGGADGERADQPGAGGDGHRVDVGERDAGGAERALDGRDHLLEVRPRSDLRDDPAEPRVLVHRGRDGVDQQLAAVGVGADQGDPGLVAGRLDPQDQRRVGHGASLGGPAV
jgi:hypothetical protein